MQKDTLSSDNIQNVETADKKKININDIWCVLIVFAVTVLLEFIMCQKTYMRVYPDDIGFMAGVAKAAGYAWDEAIAISKYYGPAYYILYFLFFYFVKNSLVLREILVIGNVIVLGLTSVTVFLTLKTLFKDEKKWWMIILSIFNVFFSIRLETSLSNEYINIFVFCLINFFLARILLNEGTKRKTVINYILLNLALVYALSIHSRNVVYVLGLGMAYLGICVLKKKLSFKVIIFLAITAFICLLAYKFLPKLFVNMIWSQRREVENTQVDTALMISRILSFDEFVLFINTLIGNIFLSIKKTCGLVLIGVYVLWADFFINQKERTQDSLSVAETGISLFSFFCYLIGMVAVSMQWRGNPKGTGYWRYYGIYAIIFCVIGVIRWYKDKKYNTMLSSIIILLTFLLAKVFFYTAWPIQSPSRYYYYGILDWMTNCSDIVKKDLLYAGTAIFLCLCVVLTVYRKRIPWIILVALLAIIPNFTGMSFMKVAYPENVEKISQIADKYRNDDVHWCFYGQDSYYLYVQYAFLDKEVVLNPSFSEKDEYVYLSNDINSFPEDIDLDEVVELDSNEFLYTTNESLLYALKQDSIY